MVYLAVILARARRCGWKESWSLAFKAVSFATIYAILTAPPGLWHDEPDLSIILANAIRSRCIDFEHWCSSLGSFLFPRILQNTNPFTGSTMEYLSFNTTQPLHLLCSWITPDLVVTLQIRLAANHEDLGNLCMKRGQTFQSSFSAVPKPTFATTKIFRKL